MPRQETALATDLHKKLRILALLALVFLVVLAVAPLKWNNSEWKDIQKEYNRRAIQAGLRPTSVAIKQIWRPEIDLTDRCISCHLGMGGAKPLPAGGKLFGAHPEVGHDIARMGCTVCHLGQGRATRTEAAHGAVEHWEEPMLPAAQAQASCGTCHGESVDTPPTSIADRGRYLFELHGCNACHKVDGRGGTVGPDLSGVALKGFDRQWHIRHLRQPAAVVEGSRMMSFGHLTDGEIDAILAYLDTLVGAPRLIEGKALAIELGCRGCHKIDGVGGDVGPDLNEAAGKSVLAYDFSHVEGEHSIDNWQRQHLRDPARVAPGSKMPAYDLGEEQTVALLTWLRSLRRPELPLDQLPARTLEVRFGSGPTRTTNGAALFRELCAVCHGEDGRGQTMASLGVTAPDIRNPDVLAIYSDSSLRYVIENGRPGRPMPAWGERAGGLSAEQIDALIAYLRQGTPERPTLQSVRRARADRRLGSTLFRNDCAGCHGARGEGTEIAPALASDELHFVADDRFLWETITSGRAGTAMPAHPHYDAEAVASLMAHLRSLAPRHITARQMRGEVRRVLGTDDLANYRASGSVAYGKYVYQATCAGCHGERGEGMVGPAIANPDFLRKTSDGFLAGTIVLGRSGRAMRAFGTRGLVQLEGREINDVIVYLRHLAGSRPKSPGGRTVQGQPSRGGELYKQYCIGCHGSEGKGQTGPALGNPAFLSAVTDGFLQATLVRGRPGTAMRAWARGRFGFEELEPRDINDIVAYIRSMERK